MKRKKWKTNFIFIFLLPSVKDKGLQKGKCKLKSNIKELKSKIDKGVENVFPKCGENFAIQLSKPKGDDLEGSTETQRHKDGLEGGRCFSTFTCFWPLRILNPKRT